MAFRYVNLTRRTNGTVALDCRLFVLSKASIDTKNYHTRFSYKRLLLYLKFGQRFCIMQADSIIYKKLGNIQNTFHLSRNYMQYATRK